MLTIKIETKNDAFKDDLITEVISCLNYVIYRMENYDYVFDIFDTNGNNVGHFKSTWKK